MVTYSGVVFTLHLLLLPTISSTLYSETSDCAWNTCRNVITRTNTEKRNPDTVFLSFHGCSPSHHLPEKCYLPGIRDNRDRISNFTMEDAGLTKIPVSDFCPFSNLRGVDLRSNLIETFTFPTRSQLPVTCLSKLTYLNLRKNQFTEINLSEFLAIQSLEHLDISENNKLTVLYVSQIYQNSKLRMLSASKCRIKVVDISIVRLVNLQDIDLSYNQVSQVSNRLRWIMTSSSIKEIENERNKLKNADPTYHVRFSINMLQNHFGPEAFGANKLWGLPVPRVQVPEDSSDKVVAALIEYRNAFYSFVYIDNTGSTITCDCHLLDAWEYFSSVYGNEIEFVKRNAISLNYWLKLPCMQVGEDDLNLKKKTIRNLKASDLLCKHVTNCPSRCTCTEYVLPSKVIVDCRRAGLREMPQRLPSSVHNVRYEILLNGNLITELREIDHPELIDVLDLSENQLNVDTNYTKLRDVLGAQINLTGNPLREFPNSLLNLTSRGRPPKFYFQSQEFLCTCALFEQDKWIDVKSLFVNYNKINCLSETGERMASLLEYKSLHCLTVQYNSTKIIYREKHIINKNIVIGVGIAAGILVLVLLVITASVILSYFFSRRRRNKYIRADSANRICSTRQASFADCPFTPQSGPTEYSQCQYGQYSNTTCVIPPDLVPYDEPRYVSSNEVRDYNNPEIALLSSVDPQQLGKRSASQRELTKQQQLQQGQTLLRQMSGPSCTPLVVRSAACTNSHSQMDLRRNRGAMTLPLGRISMEKISRSSSSDFSSDFSVHSNHSSSGSNYLSGNRPHTLSVYQPYTVCRSSRRLPQHPRTEELRVALPPPLPPRTPHSAQVLLPGMKYSSQANPAEDKIGKETDV